MHEGLVRIVVRKDSGKVKEVPGKKKVYQSYQDYENNMVYGNVCSRIFV